MAKKQYRKILLLAQGKRTGNSLLFQHFFFFVVLQICFSLLAYSSLSVFAKKSQFYLQQCSISIV